MADYIGYLAYILHAMPDEEDRIRTIAGYLLKNNARLILQSSPEVAAYAKAAVLAAFTDQSAMVRNAAGQDIVALLSVLEPRYWPECLQHLMAMLDQPDDARQEVCANIFHCECATKAFELQKIGCFQCSRESLRRYSSQTRRRNQRNSHSGLHDSKVH